MCVSSLNEYICTSYTIIFYVYIIIHRVHLFANSVQKFKFLLISDTQVRSSVTAMAFCCPQVCARRAIIACLPPPLPPQLRVVSMEGTAWQRSNVPRDPLYPQPASLVTTALSCLTVNHVLLVACTVIVKVSAGPLENVTTFCC